MSDAEYKPKVLIFDIETAHNIIASFSLLERNMISFENILQEKYMISAAWKWLGEKRVHKVSVLDDPKRFKKNPADDYHVVKTMRDEMAKADAIVAHYGDKFDIPYMNSRMAYHRIDPLPKIFQIDTCKIAKRFFKFNSNRLDYLGEFLQVGRKRHTEYGLWLKCLAGNAAAIKKMVAYNKQDITLLENVYEVLKKYVPNSCSVPKRKDNGNSCSCPKCGSTSVQKRGPDYTKQDAGWHRLRCNSCGGWSSVKLGKKKTMVR